MTAGFSSVLPVSFKANLQVIMSYRIRKHFFFLFTLQPMAFGCWTHAMHFALALWQISSVKFQAPVLISLFRRLETRVGKVQLREIILSEQVAICQADKKT